jgi:hypothetical protein
MPLGHGCFIQTHHLPVPHVIIQHHLVPVSWQLLIYGEVRLQEQVPLCPTHHYHAHLAIEAAVNQILFDKQSIFDRRQFGRELWGWAEDAAYWLKERRSEHPEVAWPTALPIPDVVDPGLPAVSTPLPAA